MQIYQCSKIGTFHTNHNEDALTINEIGDDKILIAVMDGCSAGKESHFISTLIAKILNKISKQLSYRLFVERKAEPIEYYLKEFLRNLFSDLAAIKNQLLLEKEELLSTLVLAIVDLNLKTAAIIAVGDGLLCIDGKLIEYEQDNQPDYLGYHLAEDFGTWFETQQQITFFESITDISIATDGVFTFKKFNNKAYDLLNEHELIDFLLINTQFNHQENMLDKKLLKIEQLYGLRPSDDLSIIRIIF